MASVKSRVEGAVEDEAGGLKAEPTETIPSRARSSSTAAFGGAVPSRDREEEGPKPPRLLLLDVGRVGLFVVVRGELDKDGLVGLRLKRHSSQVGSDVIGWRSGGLEADGRRGVLQPGTRRRRGQLSFPSPLDATRSAHLRTRSTPDTRSSSRSSQTFLPPSRSHPAP